MKTNRTNPIGFRPPEKLRNLLLQIAKEEQRPVSNVVVYIVNQYLSSTKGQLLKHVKIMSTKNTKDTKDTMVID